MEALSMDIPPDPDAPAPRPAPDQIRPWYAVGKAVFDGGGEAVAAARTDEEARRIAVALNAVVGMPTDALEAWTVGSIQDPVNDLLAQLESVLAPPADEDRRQGERRQRERRRAITEVRIEGK
jgi:hypothetical protein